LQGTSPKARGAKDFLSILLLAGFETKGKGHRELLGQGGEKSQRRQG